MLSTVRKSRLWTPIVGYTQQVSWVMEFRQKLGIILENKVSGNRYILRTYRIYLFTKNIHTIISLEYHQFLSKNLTNFDSPPSRNSITQLTLINSTSGHEPFEKVEFHASNQKPLSGIEFAYGWPGFYEWSYGNTILPVGAFFPAFSSKLLSCYIFVLIHTILNNRNALQIYTFFLHWKCDEM